MYKNVNDIYNLPGIIRARQAHTNTSIISDDFMLLWNFTHLQEYKANSEKSMKSI